MPASAHSRFVSGLAAASWAASWALGATTAFAEEPESYQVSATYKITLNSFAIGSLRYESNVGFNGYVVETHIELSALFGAVSWKGVTRSSGTLNGARPQPANYAFDFRGSTGAGAVHLGFGEAGVSSLSVRPARSLAADAVPLKGKHLKGVLDPLSAVLALTRTEGKSPCGRKVAIFDGQQRFDLELYYRRQQQLGEGKAIVCRVKYRPIAGHRANEETKVMSRSTGIEIAFRPVPGAGLMVPDEITIPTVSGPIALKAQRVDIKTSGRRKIALVKELGGP
ncbi:MAG: hypothetical protein ACR2PG_14890 [Hyphomicrobiaceae bacterium]